MAETVQSLYEQNPYPASAVGAPIQDLANAISFVQGDWAPSRILDAGCGSGHRLVALAKRFPNAEITGIDFAAAPLATASALLEQHGVGNVRLVQHDLTQPLAETYDVTIVSGVLHHLPDPQIGARHVLQATDPAGYMYVWLYHEYGEYERLLDRRLARLFWTHRGSPGGGEALALLRSLGLSIAADRYGSSDYRNEATKAPVDRPSIDMDAFMSPVVHSFTIVEASEMLRRAGAEWVAINAVNWPAATRLLDLENADPDASFFCVDPQELFRDSRVAAEFQTLPPALKLEAVELAARPTGFSILASRGSSPPMMGARLKGNVIPRRGNP